MILLMEGSISQVFTTVDYTKMFQNIWKLFNLSSKNKGILSWIEMAVSYLIRLDFLVLYYTNVYNEDISFKAIFHL